MDIPTHEEILEKIEGFLGRHQMRPTRFGRDATGEPQLIESMRRGRSPSLKVLERVAEFMRERDSLVSAEPSPGKTDDLAAPAGRMAEGGPARPASAQCEEAA